MSPYRTFVVFVLVLIVLRRFGGVPVSVTGSIVLTIVVSLIVRAISREKR